VCRWKSGWVNSSVNVHLFLLGGGAFFKTLLSVSYNWKRNKAKDSVCGEEVLKYLLKFNTEDMKIYVNKTILGQICHSLERKNRSFGIHFIYFDFSQIHRKVFVTCCKLQIDTKPDFYLLRTNSCFYMKIAFMSKLWKWNTVGFFCHKFLNKEQSGNTGTPLLPIFFCPSSNWYLPVPSTAISTEATRCFCNSTDIITNAAEELKRLSQNGLQECFQHLKSRWQKWIIVQRDYLEGNVV
jgi:hypothetical protein